MPYLIRVLTTFPKYGCSCLTPRHYIRCYHSAGFIFLQVLMFFYRSVGLIILQLLMFFYRSAGLTILQVLMFFNCSAGLTILQVFYAYSIVLQVFEFLLQGLRIRGYVFQHIQIAPQACWVMGEGTNRSDSSSCSSFCVFFRVGVSIFASFFERKFSFLYSPFMEIWWYYPYTCPLVHVL